MTRRWVGAVLVLALPGVAAADDDYRHGRIRHVEDGVSIQRAAEPGAEEAQPNIPFLPGDRIWTDERGRVEFQFDSGAFLRLDNGTKLDYLDNPGDRVVLRLWSGALYVHAVGSGNLDFEIETPGGVVNTRGRGIYRIDAHSGETRISVYEGDATLQGGRGARIREGERAYARDGEVTRGPMAFDRQDADDFAMWADDRQESVRTARQRPADLPEDAAPFYDELYDHGSWDREPSVGFVWRPRVAFDWQPYTFGRWMWTAYGWTWASSDPWGWAPFHYGRWGYSLAGWYWIPQRGWGPAWVNWAVGGPYVGWSPLGLRNRPIHVFDRRHRGLHEIPRVAHAIPRGHSSWVYARQGDLTARDLVRRRVQVAPAELAQVRVLASPRARLSRELRVVEAPVNQSAPPRNVRTRPTAGDTVPELRTDNQTTVPSPVARRRSEPEERHDRGHSFGEAAGRRALAAPRAPEAGAEETVPASRPVAARPTFGGGDAGRARWRAPESSAEPAGDARPEAAPVARSRPRANDGEGTPRQEYRAAPSGERSREGAAPRERARESGGGDRRSAPAERGDSGGAARSRGESAPRQESASAPAAKSAPAPSGHAVRRQRD